VVYHARLAEEIGAFAFPDVVEAITTKLIRRHPHVFGNAEARAAGAAKGFWEKAKAEERRKKGSGQAPGLLDAVAPRLPALMRAVKLQERAATVGFDWNDPKAVLTKLREEIAEIEVELDSKAAPERLEDEVGDLLFAAANLARHLKVDADQALRRTNLKFVRRFAAIEKALAATGRTPAEASLDEMEALWQKAKAGG
jgi:ATP diphosphatase